MTQLKMTHLGIDENTENKHAQESAIHSIIFKKKHPYITFIILGIPKLLARRQYC